MKNLIGSLTFGICIAAYGIIPNIAIADSPIKTTSSVEQKQKFENDRKFILSMAGNYKVRFDMQETTPWVANYKPLERKISGGYETIKVIEDTGNKISLQHLLVVDTEDGKQFLVKHWRQDWEYEPTKTLVYRGKDLWQFDEVPEAMRKGRWSQTVYQVDDSPRYAGWGAIENVAGIDRWRSNWTWRPLARRDAVRNPVYDRYYSINRQQITPTGWIHWQDNTKMGTIDGKQTAMVQEYVLNTYTKVNDYNFAIADKYWNNTNQYWKTVRNAWDENAKANNGIRVAQKAETGTEVAEELMQLADQINDGKITTKSAETKAKEIIRVLK